MEAPQKLKTGQIDDLEILRLGIYIIKEPEISVPTKCLHVFHLCNIIYGRQAMEPTVCQQMNRQRKGDAQAPRNKSHRL